MKAAFRTLLGLAVVLAVVMVVNAEDDKEKKESKSKTLKGELGCAKCVFKVKGVSKCTNAIKVKEGDKEVIYILDDKGRGEKYHGKICTDSAKGSVTGKVSKKGAQNIIKPDEDGVKYDD